ncbi:hypothetical protein FV222_17525 [Methylobacterium sp. WL103]|uniref:hypothetical protein n=1 Tax=unclassified Methylobacterium TaxID=2615210 RepID=UPI0011C7B001|nr:MULTISPECIES: hypothetical protein [unclassified Methylobacterium]TXM73956.1 hypothetical protein FV226_08005 [Methylobacterium sp. WL12]TXM96708.1 hypothetical protein FV222_17525 [Methylobacterium sp. WL103]
MRPILATALFLTLAVPALAAGPNGGVVVVADGHPIEFVASDAALTFFVTDDDGGPAKTVGVTGKAFVQAGGRTETVALAGAEPNRLVGTLKAPLPAGAKVVLSARMHGHTLQARFER